MGSFIQEVFNDISLKRDQKLWLSADDSRTQDRLRLVAQFPESSFSRLLSSSPDESCPAIRICRKNSDLCSALREKANLCYAQGDCHAALGLYNQGLQFASPEESGPILSNRSAVWVDLEDWSSGIQDIDLAFKAFKSEDLEDSGKKKTKKLLERKAQCLCSLGRISEAIKVLETLCDIFKVQGGNRNKSKLEQIMSWKKKLEKQHREQGDKVFQDKVQQLPGIDILKSPHPRIPNFSDAIKIEFTKTQGRHCVASRDIQPGELIAQDKPYVWMLDKSEVRNLCWHCFQGLRAPVPCHKCAGVLFCSEQCELP